MKRVTIAALLALCLTARADQQGETARALAARYRSSAVKLALVLKMSGGFMGIGGDQQTELEVDGVALDASGLIATTNMSIDPMALYSGITSDSSGTASQIVSVKIVTANDDEIPAKVVLRDKDRNLAFVRPLRPLAKPLAAVDFHGAGKAQMGDAVFVLGRLGKAGSRSPEIVPRRIVAVVERPRLFYVTESSMFANVGDVVFNEKGEPLGLSSIRVSTGRRSSMSLNDNFLPIVIPAEDVLDAAQHAPQAKDVKDVVPAAKTPRTPGTKTAPSHGTAKPRPGRGP